MKKLLTSEKRVPNISSGTLMFSGVLSMAVGLIYILNLPGLTGDATPTTVPWGYFAVSLGIVVLLWIVLGVNLNQKLCKLFVSINLGVVALLQLPAILAWLLFHGRVISDGPVGPVGHWLWSVPHIFLGVVSMYSIFILLCKEKRLD
ncbi:MAG: hypothetical protein AB1510_11815 [Bacillota bacterium]